LFRDGHLSLARAARLAELSLGQFVSHLSRLGIPVVTGDAQDARQDMDTLEQWLALS
jgi:predicted HTH domain antitoxin